jgi:hypothetical protein
MASMTDRPPRRTQGFLPRLRRYIEGLGLYQSLVLLLIPTSLVEPLKLIAVAVAGEGHWITGTVMIVVAYAASLLLVERLFMIVKPKLLTLPWFPALGLVCRPSRQGGWCCFAGRETKTPRLKAGLPWRPTADLALMCRLRVARAAAF